MRESTKILDESNAEGGTELQKYAEKDSYTIEEQLHAIEITGF